MNHCIRMMRQPRQAVTDVFVESVRLEDIISIRHQVLRVGQTRSSCYYPEDSYKETVHFAAKDGSNLIGCASIYKEAHPDFSLKQSWRIRGMAVLPNYQGKNIGTQLLETCINHAIIKKAGVIWCNARLNAVAFYKNSGFKIIGDEFEIENIGPHYLMAKNLGIHIGQSKFIEIAKKLWSVKPQIPVGNNKTQIPIVKSQ